MLEATPSDFRLRGQKRSSVLHQQHALENAVHQNTPEPVFAQPGFSVGVCSMRVMLVTRDISCTPPRSNTVSLNALSTTMAVCV